MKYKVSELKNNLHRNPQIEGIINYRHKIKDDIFDVDDINVKGKYSYDNSKELFKFSLNIFGSITILSAVSLKPVKLFIDFDTDLFYTFIVTDDDSFPINGDSIDLDEEIWGEIILHLPSRVIDAGEEFDESDNVELEKENPFSKLLEER